jgi:hypothetical protein
VLVHDWCQQFPSHLIGEVEFGPDGMLYPFRLTFRPGTDELWVGDVGWTRFD